MTCSSWPVVRDGGGCDSDDDYDDVVGGGDSDDDYEDDVGGGDSDDDGGGDSDYDGVGDSDDDCSYYPIILYGLCTV